MIDLLYWTVIAAPPVGLLIFVVATWRREQRADPMADVHGDVIHSANWPSEAHVHYPETFR